MGHLNIISLQNKFKVIKKVFFNNIDAFFLSEAKLDETFPSNELQIEGYKNFKLDRNCIESICLELHLRKRKWLVIGIYKPPSYCEDAFIKIFFLTNASKEFENIAFLGDFNMTAENTKMEQLLNTFSLETNHITNLF